MLCENLVVSNSIDNTFDLSYSITPWPHFTLKESILCDMQLIILYFNNLSLSIVKKLSFVLSLDRGFVLLLWITNFILSPSLWIQCYLFSFSFSSITKNHQKTKVTSFSSPLHYFWYLVSCTLFVMGLN